MKIIRMAYEITGTGRAVPSTRVTNDDLAKKIDTSDEWIRSHTGIGSRYIAGEEIAASDLGYIAARRALAMASGIKLNPENGQEELSAADEKALAEAALSLDIIVLATVTPDYIGTPSTACLIQDRLGAKNAGAMDIAAGCTGFIYALDTAAGLLAVHEERKKALVICAEILSKFTDWNDRSSCVLFGDGAGAVILEKTGAPCQGSGRRGLLRTILRADGSGAENLLLRRGGSRNPIKEGETIDKPIHIEMNGQGVYNFAVKAMTEVLDELMRRENLSIDDIARIIPHQANARIVQAAAKRLKIPEEKFCLNIEEYANTSSASIPIALDELYRDGKVKKRDLLIFIGFGGGLTYGANLLVC